MPPSPLLSRPSAPSPRCARLLLSVVLPLPFGLPARCAARSSSPLHSALWCLWRRMLPGRRLVLPPFCALELL
eukprot:5477696-Alexandrium_andersonii.AAC.1